MSSISLGIDLSTPRVVCSCGRIRRPAGGGAPIAELGRVELEPSQGEPLPSCLLDVIRDLRFKDVVIGGYQIPVDADLSKLRIVFAGDEHDD